LDIPARVRLRRAVEQLEQRNVLAREPLVRHLEGQLWELRLESRTNIYRVVYFFYTGRRIVLLHGFQKKTQKTPRREIDMAERRLAQFLEQEKQR
jgi:phage-related protein